MTHLKLPVGLLDSLPSLRPTLEHLRALLHSPYPPRSLFIHALSNNHLLPHVLSCTLPSVSYGDYDESPDVQDLLPDHVHVDCAETASLKAFFGTILNGLAGWTDDALVWNEELGGVLNWDGRLEGCRSAWDEGSGSWKARWDVDALEPIAASTKKGAMSEERKDESLSAFIDGLKCLFEIGGDSHPSSKKKKPRPRFIVVQNAERLSSLESIPVGQTDGTLLAAFMRLGELTGRPIVPVLMSSTDWSLLRPSKGVTEPAAIVPIPCLAQKDIPIYLSRVFVPPPSAVLSSGQSKILLDHLIPILIQTFSPYLSNSLTDYQYLLDRLWPAWAGTVESGQVAFTTSNGDEEGTEINVNRLMALNKGRLAREIEFLGELRLAMSTADEKQGPLSSSTMSPLKQSQSRLPFISPTKSAFASPSHRASPLASPTKAGYNAAAAAAPAAQLALALPLVSKYLLIAAYLASSNPARKDVLMVAVTEDEALLSKKRKKGGATRRTPSKKARVEGDGTITRLEAPPARLLGPKAFNVERLLAIFECILPREERHLASGPDVLNELARLASLRLLLKVSAGGSALPSAAAASAGTMAAAGADPVFDRLEGLKLKINNLELDQVEVLGKSVGFKVAERLWEAAPA